MLSLVYHLRVIRPIDLGPGTRFDVILPTPPFGKKSSTVLNEAGEPTIFSPFRLSMLYF
ncbi:hypothetical protein ABIB60_003028 [Hymenobacter sp. UYP22]